MKIRAFALSGEPKGASPFFFRAVAAPLCVFVAGLMAATGCKREVPLEFAQHDVHFRAHDGVELAGTVFAQGNPGAPGILLIHGLGDDRTVWTALARTLVDSGYTCLSVDLRGHGQSVRGGGGEPLSYRALPRDGWAAALADVEAAYEFLGQNADHTNRAVIGTALGANLALAFAAKQPDVRTVVLISPGGEFGGVTLPRDLSATARTPVLLVAAEGDSYSASAVTRLKDTAPGYCELRLYGGALHGAALLNGTGDVQGQIVDWLETTVLRAKVAGDAP